VTGLLLGAAAIIGLIVFAGSRKNGETPSRIKDGEDPITRTPKSGGSVPKRSNGRTTIRLGSKGGDVSTWQGIIGVKADGIFGPITDSVTRTWQREHGLVADGIVGPKTWAESMNYPVGM
jgi:peptidoglycan hydrolase-like protein with peptidoglycan-binding domain